MRVHPTVVHSTKARWHFPVAVTLLLLVLVSNVYKGARSTANAVPEVKNIPVVVARASIEAGKPIAKELLAVELRPASTLPAEALSRIDDVVGKFPTAPILAGYPIAKPLIADKAVIDEKKSVSAVADLVQEKLAGVVKETIGVNVQFQNALPPRGARIAIAVQGKTGLSQIVADEAWVENVDKQTATVRVRQNVALLLQDVRNLGGFSFFIIPDEGPSPFAADVVADLNVLRERLAPETKPVVAANTPSAEKKTRKRGSDFSSYAWVAGEGVKYSIDDQGKMFVIDRSGSAVPLYNFEEESSAEAPPAAAAAPADQSVTGEIISSIEGYRERSEKKHAPGEVRTGLEPFFPKDVNQQ